MNKMDGTFLARIFVITLCISKTVVSQLREDARWCTINDDEFSKCQGLVTAINQRILLSRPYPPNYIGKNYPDLPLFGCVQGTDQYDCMTMISQGMADIMQLETGLSYTAGENFNMMPLVAEQYVISQGDEGLTFYAVAVVRKSNPNIDINHLQGTRACFPGVGRAAGWTYPISNLMSMGIMGIVECNVPVKSAAAFFGPMCAPDALARFYNPFGNNPVTVCDTCKGTFYDFCTVNDPYADYPGALDCLFNNYGDVAFVRNSSLVQVLSNTNTTLTIDDFEIICPNGPTLRTTPDNYLNCNWGQIASHVVMTSAMVDADSRNDLTSLLLLISMDFGATGTNNDLFKVFESINYGKQNLLFTDETQQLKDVNTVAGGTRDTYYSWVGDDLRQHLLTLNTCPLQQARWCVISPYEMTKCENMIMAFAAKNLKPDLNCIMGSSVLDCMQMIRLGDADLITLDAADVYLAGKKYGLVPIANEDYSGSGDGDSGYYAVAIARRAEPYMTLFNLKQRRSCHASVMSAAGWIVPVDVLIETGQITIPGCNAYLSVGQYFMKSCVPGLLDNYYNPDGTNPVNLCEACSTAGPRRCMRNDQELYYGSSGAFRCLVERGGHVAFVRHTTVRENTDGRNQADWSRNRRSDDYELLCNDGTRNDIDQWATCNLGLLPPNAIVTAGFKTANERGIFWTLLNFAEQFYDSDTNPDFPMFESFLNHKDLIFQDATVRLELINSTLQNYKDFLGPSFIRAMQRMESRDCVTGSGADAFHRLRRGVLTTTMTIISTVVAITITQFVVTVS